MGYRHHGVKTGGLPEEYIRSILTGLDVRVFIETGTAGGESVREAAQMFSICHTIEVVDGRGRDTEYPKNVSLHTGNSAELIGPLASNYKKDWIFFWLDAHWSEPHEATEDVMECPLIEEIKAINHAKAIIMIDDARLFLGPPVWPCDPRKWPKFKDVILNLQYKWPDHIITVVDDYIVCLPQEIKDNFYNEWRGRFDQRYPSEESKIKQSARNVYESFIKYIS